MALLTRGGTRAIVVKQRSTITDHSTTPVPFLDCCHFVLMPFYWRGMSLLWCLWRTEYVDTTCRHVFPD